jgi:hypothetical protein
MSNIKSLYIGLDFDGTVVHNKYPELGEPIDGALEVLEKLVKVGHKLILYTMRSEERLAQAAIYLEENGIELYAINDNPSQKYWTKSPKIFCNLYIDDCSLGTPLLVDTVNGKDGRPYVDWEQVEKLLIERELI